MPTVPVSGLLVRTRADAGVERVALSGALAAAGSPFEIEPLFRVGGGGPGLAVGAAEWQWYVARPKRDLRGANAWQLAHSAMKAGLAEAPGQVFVEPDLQQQFPLEQPPKPARPGLAVAKPDCTFVDQNPKLPTVSGSFGWHLDDTYSQLRAARADAKGTGTVRIVHLDTGYDAQHAALKTAHLNAELARDFLARPPANGAIDPGNDGFMENPGHGTATLSLLAGTRIACAANGYQFDDVLGGAPDAELVPVRVGNSVVQIWTSTVAAGIAYACDLTTSGTPVHVISMSMGGVASLAWADAVNKAYDAGIVFVAAAGNNYSAGLFGVPTHFIVYPARFRRVIAACGIMADRRPYYDLPYGTMQGNWGPGSKMATAVAAFTPNVPWAKWGCADIVDMDGQGTSSATPQVASAAALYFQKHFDVLMNAARYPQPWMRVEAVRAALFGSADKSGATGNEDKLGNGILQAARALKVDPAPAQSLNRCAEDNPIFPFLRVLTGLGAAESSESDMLALEATQLAQRGREGDGPNPFESGSSSDPDQPLESISSDQRRRFLEALESHPDASAQLRQRLQDLLADDGGGKRRPRRRTPVEPAPEPAAFPSDKPARFVPPDPPTRALRGFSIDPSLSTQLDTAPISTVTFHVPWEELQRGPAGEYIEVVDVDPGSGCAYEPVDLNDQRILAQDGLAPSEGTPQFHQQMVYAVARLTINNFERALGRRTLWRPGPPPKGAHPKNDATFVPRLRIYPHALREANAYYSPAKIALLFGYFNASPTDPGDHLPRGRVFTCLSHDIIAHETTHALLDGMHRRFLRPTNPDVHAFHEAFADIVALFQHFTFPEIVRHQIKATRGAVRSHENLLGQLAGQFGRAIGNRGALRDSIGVIKDGEWVPVKPDPLQYASTTEPHERGAVLVAAVFDAFLSIYERRTADLLRLATGGTGILNPGEIHPDLADRLANECAKAADHVLGMCVRALDYSPPTDITFGEYLRALITADYDLVPDDDLNYRVSFIEAFRRRGIYPHNVRTLSVDNLCWRAAESDSRSPSAKMAVGLGGMREYAEANLYADSREKVFHIQRDMRRKLHEWLEQHFKDPGAGAQDAAFLGLDPALGFEVHTARFAYRVSPDGEMKPQLLVGILQDRRVPLDPGDPKGETMMVEGGCSIVADLRQRTIGYCIRKSLTSESRIDRQRSFTAGLNASTRAIYLGHPGTEPHDEPFAALHRS